MDAKEKFRQYIKDSGLRQSAPRDAVVSVFLRTEKHVSTQELFEIVKKKHKTVGYATVARTMKLLAQAGLCRVVDFGDGLQRYEHEYGHEHHDHLICTKCGKFVEIYSKKLEKAQDELVKKHGYRQVSHKLQIYGICPKCEKKKK
jgi:Fur family ferric uptake transcriptional regulator